MFLASETESTAKAVPCPWQQWGVCDLREVILVGISDDSH